MAQQTKSRSRTNGAGSSAKRTASSSSSRDKPGPPSQRSSLAQKLKTPSIAAGAAAAGLAGGLALAGRGRRKTVFGMRWPKAGDAQATSKNLAEAAKQIGSFGERVGELATEVRMVREGVAQTRNRSPIEVVLQGLTSRRT